MEHFICRCEHCGASYTYCTYGNDDGCTEQYCGTCATAIKEALRAIPTRYVGKRNQVTDESKINEIVQIFNQEAEEYLQNHFPKVVRVIYDWGYEKVEGCYINRTEYYRCTNKNGDVHIYRIEEFDTLENRFTGKDYFENNKPHRGYFLLSQLNFDKFKDRIKVVPMDKPTGKLFFNDIFEWDVIPPNTTDN